MYGKGARLALLLNRIAGLGTLPGMQQKRTRKMSSKIY